MLCFENVRKVYKDFELNCSMRVEPGCITGLIGPERVQLLKRRLG